MKSIFRPAVKKDPELKSCVQDLAHKHGQIFQSFYGLL